MKLVILSLGNIIRRCRRTNIEITIEGGLRRAEKSRKVLMMMMKAAKLGWAETAGQEQDWRKARARLKHKHKFRPRSQAAPEGAQLSQTSPRKNGKPRYPEWLKKSN